MRDYTAAMKGLKKREILEKRRRSKDTKDDLLDFSPAGVIRERITSHVYLWISPAKRSAENRQKKRLRRSSAALCQLEHAVRIPGSSETENEKLATDLESVNEKTCEEAPTTPNTRRLCDIFGAIAAPGPSFLV
jgi:hypothetical protein